MVKTWFAISIVFMGSLVSCSDFKKGSYLESLEDLQKTVDSIETVLIENKIDTFPRLMTSVLMLELHLKDEIAADTLALDMAEKVNDFQRSIIDLKPLDSTYQSIFQAIPHQRFSLQLLENEVQNDSGDRHKYEENLAFEKKRVKGLNTLLSDYIERKNSSLEGIQRNFSPLSAFVEELKSAKK